MILVGASSILAACIRTIACRLPRSRQPKAGAMRWMSFAFTVLLSASSTILGASAAEPSPRLHILAGSELDYAPYALVTKDGQPDGFSVDLLKAVCEAMNIDVSFRVGPWSEVRRALEKGEINVLPLVSYSKERDRVFDFSVTHTVANGIIFKRLGSPDIKQTSDLRGKPLIVMQADAAHDWLLRNDITNDLLLADTVAESLQFLADGLQEYALTPRLVGLLTAKKLGLENIETTGPLIDAYGRGYGFAVKSGNFALLKKLNEGLSIVRATGRYDAIYQKWFGSVDPKGVPVAVILRYSAIGGGGIVVLSVLILVWIIALRRTVRRQTETLRTAYAEVEHKVAERTRELRAEATPAATDRGRTAPKRSTVPVAGQGRPDGHRDPGPGWPHSMGQRRNVAPHRLDPGRDDRQDVPRDPHARSCR